MDRPTERLKPIGFWSYARQDDDASDGRLSRLRVRLAKELQQFYGRSPVRIWQDVAAIPPGAEWEKQIDCAIGESTFLIPIITPAFVESEWCCREVRKFLDREREIDRAHPEIGGRRRIFPIRYIEIRDCDPLDPLLIAELDKLQMTDFTAVRLLDDGSVQERKLIARIAAEVDVLLKIRVRRPLTPQELEEEAASDRKEAEAKAIRVTEAERMAAQLEAERLAEAQLPETDTERAWREDPMGALGAPVGAMAGPRVLLLGLAATVGAVLLVLLAAKVLTGPSGMGELSEDVAESRPSDMASALPQVRAGTISPCKAYADAWDVAVRSGSERRIAEAGENARQVQDACPELTRRVTEYRTPPTLARRSLSGPSPTPTAQTNRAGAPNGERVRAPETTTSAATGPVAVQLGAYSSLALAETGWGEFSNRYDALQGRGHRVLEGAVGGTSIFRLQALAGSVAEAETLCRAMKVQGGNCQVVR